MINLLTPVLAAKKAQSGAGAKSPSYKSLDSFEETPSVSKGFSNMGSHLADFANYATTFGIVLLTIVTILVGIGCIFGGEEYREKLKKIFPWLLGATALMVLAKTVAKALLAATGAGA